LEEDQVTQTWVKSKDEEGTAHTLEKSKLNEGKGLRKTL